MLRLIKLDLRNGYFGWIFLISGLNCALSTVFYGVQDLWDGDIISFLLFGIPYAAVCTLLKSHREKESGFYRNMITAGYTKRQVFFAHVLSSALYGAVYFLFTGIPYMFFIDGYVVLTGMMIFAVVSAAVSCLYLLTENILVVIFAALAIAAVSMSIDYCIRDPLDEPKYNIEYYDIHSGKMVKYYDVNEDGKVIKEENPDYIGGTERALLSAVKCISPYSQLKELSESERNPFYVLSDAGLIVLITSGGYLIWRKKDLF